MNKPIVRVWISAMITFVIMGVFVARLLNIQIVEAETYKKLVGGGDLYKQVIKATRGEIVDKNLSPFAENRLGYDVIIDKAAFPSADANDTILKLMNLCNSLGEDWTDNLPITKTAPYEYLPDREQDIARLKKFLEVQDYATASDVLYQLDKRYKTDATLSEDSEEKKFTPQEARKIVGVRYEMEQRGFNYSVTYTFATDISIASVVQIKERSYMLPGVEVIESTVRTNPDGTVAPHLIGQIGPIYAEEYQELKKKGYAQNDVLGKSGSEVAFEDELRGDDGERQIFCDSNGRVIEAVETKPPTPGNTIVLTLDKDLQQKTQEALENQIKYLNEHAPAGEGREADYGAVAVVECKTGKILALVTTPTYNLNDYYKEYTKLAKETPGSPLINRAIQGLYAPGSCFKPVVATAGLGSGVITPASTYMCGHVFMLPGSSQRFTCLGTHGNLNVITALRFSCNIFFYNTGLNCGIDLVDKTARQYGLGEHTGIELSEEYKGRRSNPETKMEVEGVEWYPGDTLQSSIGQLYHAYTPLQMANYAATIANRGTRMKLTLVEEIRDYSRQRVVRPFEAQVADHVAQPAEAFETVVQGMVTASRIGTASAYFGNYPVDVASKTGTPETHELPNSTFICFAPAEDPQIAIAVVIEKGWHGYTGAPVAKEIFNEYFGYNKQQEQAPASAASADAASSSQTASSPEASSMPSQSPSASAQTSSSQGE